MRVCVVSLVDWTRQVVTLVQNEDFYPHPIRRELKPIVDLFTAKNMGEITYKEKAINMSEMRGWLADYYQDYCQIFQLDCRQTGCGISDDCEAGQFCQDREDGQFDCGDSRAERSSITQTRGGIYLFLRKMGGNLVKMEVNLAKIGVDLGKS